MILAPVEELVSRRVGIRNLFAVLGFCLTTGVACSTVIFWSMASAPLDARDRSLYPISLR